MRTRTSRAGESGRTSPDAGFTLIELLAVFAIIAFALGALVLPSMNRSTTARLKSAAFETAALLRLARSDAILRGEPREVLVDVDRRLISAQANGRPVMVDRNIRITLAAAANAQISRSASVVRFFPNGSSSGATLKFADSRDAFEVRVNWLSGRVSIHAVR